MCIYVCACVFVYMCFVMGVRWEPWGGERGEGGGAGEVVLIWTVCCCRDMTGTDDLACFLTGERNHCYTVLFVPQCSVCLSVSHTHRCMHIHATPPPPPPPTHTHTHTHTYMHTHSHTHTCTHTHTHSMAVCTLTAGDC